MQLTDKQRAAVKSHGVGYSGLPTVRESGVNATIEGLFYGTTVRPVHESNGYGYEGDSSRSKHPRS